MLRFYYSKKCDKSMKLLNHLKGNYPHLINKFSIICIDAYVEKKQQYPKGIRGTPTVIREADRLYVYEGTKKILEIINILNNNSPSGGGNNNQNNIHTNYDQPPRQQNIKDDDFQTPPPSFGQNAKYNKGVSVKILNKNHSWANKIVEGNKDVKQFQEDMSTSSSKEEDLARKLRKLEKARNYQTK